MLTTRSAATLLGAIDSIDGLVRLGREIGFRGPATALDPQARDAIGVPAEATAATIIVGEGSLRAIAISMASVDTRGMLRRLATALGTRAPHVLWMVLVADSGGDTLAIGAPSLDRRPPRMAALVLSRSRVMDSDAQAVRLLRAATSADDLATHARYVDILGREALSRRFFRTLESCVAEVAASSSLGSAEARSEIALLYASRLLFLAFVEVKGWLDDDPAFLARAFDEAMTSGGDFHSRVLLPLFFGTLNTPPSKRAARARAFGRIPFLNGGLFTPTPVESRLKRLRFDDAALGRFFGDLLGRYRFTAVEESSSLEEAAIDPEMLGRTFECLMARSSRRASGAFYTPQELVARVADSGLEELLASRLGHSVAAAAMQGHSLPPGASEAVNGALRQLRVLDPACGSGAFLVHALERISSMRGATGDARPAELIRREVLSRSIFGVDVNPTAVWLCQLRLWLSVVIDADRAGGFGPLPNLDRNIRAGDSLAGSAFASDPPVGTDRARRLRERYARASGPRKASLARALDREERRLLLQSIHSELTTISASRRDLIIARRGRDLFGGRYRATRDEEAQAAALRDESAELRKRRRVIQAGGALPISFTAHFADVAAAAGFDLIVGNPPWVRPHHVEARMRAELRSRFAVARSAPWSAGAEASGAGRGFASQVDLAALFIERGIGLLAPRGALAFLLPTKLWRSLSGGGMRRLLLDATRVARLEDYADMPAAFDAAVYPGLLVAIRGQADDGAHCARLATLHRGRTPTVWTDHMASVTLDGSPGAPWLLVPPRVRRAFDALRDAGIPLAESTLGRPLLGVKCGFNDAFIVQPGESRDGFTRVTATNGREGLIESIHLRPLIRGEEIRPWQIGATPHSIIWPYDQAGGVMRSLTPALHRWLAPHRPALKARSDNHSAARWWELFRIDGARSDRPRVVWADIGRAPRAAVLDAGNAAVPINTCYAIRCADIEDAWALAALLNSNVIAAWLSVLAEPARGGYRRHLGWTMSQLPIPRRWSEWRPSLAAIGRAHASAGELDLAVLEAFGMGRPTIEPLLTWSAP